MAIITKTKITADLLRENIFSGKFIDGKLPKEIELAKILQVGRITVRNALDILESENLIERHRRFGTFIVDKKNHRSVNGIVGLMIRTKGDLYSEIHCGLVNKLSEIGYASRSVSTSGMDNSIRGRPVINRSAGKLLDANLAGLVLDGYVNNAFPYIEALKKQHPVFIDFFDSGMERTNSGVWFDYKKAGYLGGKYLMEHGCKHPLLIPHVLNQSVRYSPNAYSVHRERQVFDGYNEALKEYGLDGGIYSVTEFRDIEKDEDFFVGLLSNPALTPDGILGSSDSFIVSFLKTALEIKGHLPKNFTLIGMNNTPCSHNNSLIPFSSIDLNVDDLVTNVVEQIQQPFEKRKDIYIEPRLIIR